MSVSPFSLSQQHICLIQASWHAPLVKSLIDHFFKQAATHGLAAEQVDTVTVPGSLEMPLQAKLRAKTGQYDAILLAGLITDGGIYRHEFVAQAVLNSVMQVQLEQEVPIIYAVLTPHHFHEHEAHSDFFAEHLKTKGEETADALQQTLACCAQAASLSVA